MNWKTCKQFVDVIDSRASTPEPIEFSIFLSQLISSFRLFACNSIDFCLFDPRVGEIYVGWGSLIWRIAEKALENISTVSEKTKIEIIEHEQRKVPIFIIIFSLSSSWHRFWRSVHHFVRFGCAPKPIYDFSPTLGLRSLLNGVSKKVTSRGDDDDADARLFSWSCDVNPSFLCKFECLSLAMRPIICSFVTSLSIARLRRQHEAEKNRDSHSNHRRATGK